MKLIKRALLGAVFAASLATPIAGAHAKDMTILTSVPGLNFPFFVHMLNAMKDEVKKMGAAAQESDGQNSAPKQTADVGADNVKGGEAQGQWVLDSFPNGATIINLQGQPGASPAIDRNKGLHNVLDQHKDKYKVVAEQTANFARDQGLSVTEGLLASQTTPPDVIVAANDDMALGALEAVKGRNLQSKIKVIGFDALPEALGSIRDGALAGTVEQFPGKQSATAVDILVEYLKSQKKPEKDLVLLTPIVLTKANLDKAERLNEVK